MSARGGTPEELAPPADLDPADWDDFRRQSHQILDELISHLQTIRERPVWQPAPGETRDRFAQSLPTESNALSSVLDEVRAHIIPFANGNLHPRFMGWVHGAGTPVGMLADMIAAGLNMNCGGRNHIGIEVEQQIAGWMREAFGFPKGASGVFVTGSSMANFLAVVAAKINAVGVENRRHGLCADGRQLIAYTSREAHSCVIRAIELAGIGSDNLRTIAVDSLDRMDLNDLGSSISVDRAAGFLPFLVVATAGTVNTGAIDPLARIAEVARREGLWMHVDGAIGALGIFSSELRQLFTGIEASHSIALDFHKCGHVPYDAGFLLVRDGKRHKEAFASSTGYLERAERGLAVGETWPCDLGLDLSRGFRALKTWMTLKTFGTDKLGQSIAKNCELARYFAARVEQSDVFDLKAPVAFNIVCFGVRDAGDGRVNRELVMDIQQAGIAAPSWTTRSNESVIRCAIVNHRTTRADIDNMLDYLTGLARARMT